MGQNSFSGEESRRRESPPSSPKKGSVLDESLELFRRTLEMKKLLDQNQRSSGSGLLIGMANMLHGSVGSGGAPQLGSFLMMQNILNSSKNVGFRGHLCHNCFLYWVDSVSTNKEEGMKTLILQKPSSHQCDPHRVQEQEQDLETRKSASLKGLSDLLISFVSPVVLLDQLGQHIIHLNIEELDTIPSVSTVPGRPGQQNGPRLGNSKEMSGKELGNRQSSSWANEQECINIGNLKAIKENHWILRAIKEGGHKKMIVIDGNELIEFVTTAKATFETFKVQMEDGTTRYFFVYFDLGSGGGNFANEDP